MRKSATNAQYCFTIYLKYKENGTVVFSTILIMHLFDSKTKGKNIQGLVYKSVIQHGTKVQKVATSTYSSHFCEQWFLPFGSLPPSTVNLCGFFRNSTTSCNSCLASSTYTLKACHKKSISIQKILHLFCR